MAWPLQDYVGVASKASLGSAKEEIRRTTVNLTFENIEGQNGASSEAFLPSLKAQASRHLCYYALNPSQMVGSSF